MTERADRLGIALALLFVIVGVAGLGWAATSPEYQQQYEHELAKAEAYCEQVYGEPDVYQANVVGGHGGFHCIANTDTDGVERTGPHLHEVPDEHKQRALEASRNGTDLSWTVDDAHKHADPRPWWKMFEPLPIVVALAVVITLVLGLIGRVRD